MKANNDLISVIIPIYNAENYIDKCLQSIINQSYDNLEIILINDGSTDDSLKICEKYRKDNSNIILINGKNRGPSYSRNLGIQKSTGMYIVFVDADDYCEKNMIELLHENMKKCNVQLSIVGRDMLTENNLLIASTAGKSKILSRIEVSEMILRVNESKVLNISGGPVTKLYISKIIKNNNITFKKNIHMCEDMIFNLEYLNECNLVFYDPKVMYHYIQHSESITNNKYYTYDTLLIDKTILYADEFYQSLFVNTVLENIAYIRIFRDNFSLLFRYREIIKEKREWELYKQIKSNMKITIKNILWTQEISVIQRFKYCFATYSSLNLFILFCNMMGVNGNGKK